VPTVWLPAVAERDHDIQNPTNAEKIRVLGERMRLTPGSRVLDVGAGRGGPALVLAQAFGCRLTCIEGYEGFADVARNRSRAADLDTLVEVITSDARKVSFEPAAYDAALCLGATFIWSNLDGTVEALLPTVRAGGYLAIGTPYWRRWPLPDDVDAQDYVPLADTIGRFEAHGLVVVSLIASSEDDWDAYNSLHWRACEEWLVENPDHREAGALRAEHLSAKNHYLRVERDLLGWAILVGWKC